MCAERPPRIIGAMVRAAMLFLLAAGLCAQELPTAFDAVSVRPCSSGGERWAFRRLPGGGLDAAVSVELLMVLAYDLQTFQFPGIPKWAKDDCWSIHATAHGITGQPTAAQHAPMLRSLLQDRFQLKLRQETHEGSVYYLATAKGGPKLKPHPEGSADNLFRAFQTSWQFRNVDIPALARRLSRQVERDVIDRTGIAGKFDMNLEFTRDDGASDTAGNRPSIFTALQKQLGLKLEAGKGAVTVYVVEHLEKPSAN